MNPERNEDQQFIPRQDSSSETQNDEWEGIANPEFRAFMVKVQKNLVPADDNYYYVARSFQPLVPDLYPHLRVSVQQGTNRLLARLGPLSDHRVLKLIPEEQVNVQSRVLLADKDNMIKAASYIFGRREIEKGEGKNCSVEQALGVTTELWGEHPNAGFFREATENERVRSEKARANNKSRDSSGSSWEPQSKEQVLYLNRIPEGGIDFGEYDKEKLFKEAQRIAGENVNYSIERNIEKNINSFLPLTPEIIIALRFVWFVDTNDLFHFNKSEPLISAAELIEDIMHSASEVKEFEKRVKRNGRDVKITFAHIFGMRVNGVKRLAEIAEKKAARDRGYASSSR